jgi:hypothetical protein
MNKITKLSFAGERFYCGIDVHKLSWHVIFAAQPKKVGFRQVPGPTASAAKRTKNLTP